MTLLEEIEFNKEEQYKKTFFNIAASGIQMGLTYPTEWFDNYIRCLTMCHPYAEVAKEEAKAIEAMAFFFRQTACHPDEGDTFKNMTDVELINYMDVLEKAKMKYNYEQAKKHYERTPRDPNQDCKV
jgi:hypothetical protein